MKSGSDNLKPIRDGYIKHILEHLGLWAQKPSRDSPKQETPSGNNELIYEPFDVGWFRYYEDSIVLN